MSTDTQEMPTGRPDDTPEVVEAREVVDAAAGTTHRGHVRPDNQDRFYGRGRRRRRRRGRPRRAAPRDRGREHPGARPGEAEVRLGGMGTTVTAMALEGDHAHLAHVGDSRAHRLRDDELEQLTNDHTLAHRLVEAGVLDPEAERDHPDRHVITRAVGPKASVDIDVTVTDLVVGDVILLCSDGLTGVVEDPGIANVLRSVPEPSEAADALVRRALDAGGPDDVTALVVRIDGVAL